MGMNKKLINNHIAEFDFIFGNNKTRKTKFI